MAAQSAWATSSFRSIGISRFEVWLWLGFTAFFFTFRKATLGSGSPIGLGHIVLQENGDFAFRRVALAGFHCFLQEHLGSAARGGSRYSGQGPPGRVLAVRRFSPLRRREGPHPRPPKSPAFYGVLCFSLFFPFFGACGSRWLNMGEDRPQDGST